MTTIFLDVITFVDYIAVMVLELKLRKVGNSVGVILPMGRRSPV